MLTGEKPEEGSRAAARTATEQAEDSGPEMQELIPQAHIYRLIVQRSPDHQFCWQVIGLKDFDLAFGPLSLASKREAKWYAHFWAFADSGDSLHHCGGNCVPWERLF